MVYTVYGLFEYILYFSGSKGGSLEVSIGKSPENVCQFRTGCFGALYFSLLDESWSERTIQYVGAFLNRF